MERDLRAALLAHAAIAEILDGPDRLAWGRVGQGVAMPYAALTTIAPGYDYSLAGLAATRQAIVQIDCYAATVAAVLALADAVERAAQDLVEPPFQFCELLARRGPDDGELDLGPDPTGAGEIFRTSIDVRVTWTPTL